jgi:hypothetical protein
VIIAYEMPMSMLPSAIASNAPIYEMSLIECTPKCKKEVEQLRKSSLEDCSSHEYLLSNWFELDTYAKLLGKEETPPFPMMQFLGFYEAQ